MWYVLRVPPTKEIAAQTVLQRRGFKVLLPTEERAYKKRNKREHILRRYPIMSGYVLAQFPEPVHWFDVFEIPLMRGVIGWDGKPRAVPYDRLEDLMRRTGQYVSQIPGRRSLRQGDAVRVVAGAWSGWESRVEEITDGTCEIVVQLFNRPAKIRVAIEELEPA